MKKELFLIDVKSLRDYELCPGQSSIQLLSHFENKLVFGFYIVPDKLINEVSLFLSTYILNRHPQILKIYFQCLLHKDSDKVGIVRKVLTHRKDYTLLKFCVIYRSGWSKINYCPEDRSTALESIILGCIDTHDVDFCWVISDKCSHRNIVESITHESVELVFKTFRELEKQITT